MYDKNNISYVRQRVNNGKEVGSSTNVRRPKVETHILRKKTTIAKRKEQKKDMYMGSPLEIRRVEYSLRLPQREGKLLIRNLHNTVMLQA
jgi:hypothetical protein